MADAWEERLDKWPKIGIAIANHNKAPYLEQCLDSVFKQTYPNFQVSVVDDGSTDESMNVIRRFATRNSNLSVIRFNKNQGVARARNAAIDALDCGWVTTLDSDDFFQVPEKLQSEMDLVLDSGHKSIAAYSRVFRVDQWGHRKRDWLARRPAREGWLFEDLLTRSCLIPRDFLFPRHLFETAGPFDPALPAYEDWDFKVRLSRHVRFAFTGEPGVAYRQTSSGLSTISDQNHFKWMWEVFNRYAHLAADPASARARLEANMQPHWLYRVASGVSGHMRAATRAGRRRRRG